MAQAQAHLTPEEITAVQNTWNVVYKEPEKNGAIILKTFLDKHDYYYKFERFKDFPRDKIQENPIFLNHCLKLMQTLNEVLVNLSNEQKVATLLQGLGKAHAKRKIEKEQFQNLSVVVVDILKGPFHVKENESAAWQRFFEVAFPHVYKGLAMK